MLSWLLGINGTAVLRLSALWAQGRGKSTVRSSVTVGFAADKAVFEGHAEELSLSRRFQLGVPLGSCVLGLSPSLWGCCLFGSVCLLSNMLSGWQPGFCIGILNMEHCAAHQEQLPWGLKEKADQQYDLKYQHIAIHPKIISLSLFHWWLLWLLVITQALSSHQLCVSALNNTAGAFGVCFVGWNTPESPSSEKQLLFFLLKGSTFCSFCTWIELPAQSNQLLSSASLWLFFSWIWNAGLV